MEAWCDICRKNTWTSKQEGIQQLAPNVILHVNRSYVEYTRPKPQKTSEPQRSNTSLTVPLLLDFSVFGMVSPLSSSVSSSSSSLSSAETSFESNSPMIYELVSVVLQFGSAENGHYVVLKKDRNNTSEPAQWVSLNDEFKKICPTPTQDNIGSSIVMYCYEQLLSTKITAPAASSSSSSLSTSSSSTCSSTASAKG